MNEPTIKALTLHQPWASLIAWEDKKFETRSWETPYRGLLAIHAGKTLDLEMYHSDAIQTLLQPYYDMGLCKDAEDAKKLFPLGGFVAMSWLLDCLKTEDLRKSQTYMHREWVRERSFGNFSAGRYAWHLGHTVSITNKIAARGYQGLWTPKGPVRERLDRIADHFEDMERVDL